MPVADLPDSLSAEWRGATDHPFLTGVRDGTVPEEAFDTWLVQDAHFVADLLWFQARLLARVPGPARAVLAGGAVALVEELAWFDEQAAARGLTLGAPRTSATENYATLLRRLDAAAPGVALTALWTIEQVYLDAWSAAAPGAPQYREFVAHWTAPGFRGYVEKLARAADAALADAPAGEARSVVADVLAAESAFWDMAVHGP
jgi:formylaminopyrimidine deformylase / aminopyrimidine aminohydrolase